MKNVLLFVLIGLFMVPSISHASSDDAKPTANISIAVVDVQQLMSESKAAKSIRSQGEKLRDKYQKDIDDIQGELKSLEEKLVALSKDKDTNQEEFLKQREKFQKRLIEGQKEVVQINQKMDQSLKASLNKLRDEIVKIVSDIATEKKYDLIISRADVVIVSKSVDITSTIMKRLNDKISTISVK